MIDYSSYTETELVLEYYGVLNDLAKITGTAQVVTFMDIEFWPSYVFEYKKILDTIMFEITLRKNNN
jgi:hypothetical protein